MEAWSILYSNFVFQGAILKNNFDLLFKIYVCFDFHNFTKSRINVYGPKNRRHKKYEEEKLINLIFFITSIDFSSLSCGIVSIQLKQDDISVNENKATFTRAKVDRI